MPHPSLPVRRPATRPFAWRRLGIAPFLGILLLPWRLPGEEAIPPLDVSESLQKGVQHALRKAESQEQGFFFPPLTARKIVGWKTRTVRYRVVEKEVPIYRYETYEVMVPGQDTLSAPRKVTQRRIVGVEEGKTVTRSYQVNDPEGPLSKEIRYPVYEATDSNAWSYGALGMNAAAVLALVQCGVDPGQPVVRENAYRLASFVREFGPPDHLVDLAWMTACFAALPGSDHEALALECAAKLLDAQVQDGAGKGMWGPIAIHTAMLSHVLRASTRVAGELAECELKIREESKGVRDPEGNPSMRLRRLREEKEELSQHLTSLYADRSSQLGPLLYLSMGKDYKDLVPLKTEMEQAQVMGLPYLIHNQVTTDLESSALAAFALRMARERNRLPIVTRRPEALGSFDKLPPPPPRDARQALSLAYQTLLQARQANGVWSEMNAHQPVTDLAWLESIPQARADAFAPLSSPSDARSLAIGAGAVMNLGLILQGPEAAGRALAYPVLLNALETRLREPPANPSGKGDAPSLFPALPFLARLRPEGQAEAASPGWRLLAEWLLRGQNAEGGWGNPKRRQPLIGGSIRARLETVPKQVMRDAMDKPHLVPGLYFQPLVNSHYSVDEEMFATVMALLFLSDGKPAGWSPELLPVAEPGTNE